METRKLFNSLPAKGVGALSVALSALCATSCSTEMTAPDIESGNKITLTASTAPESRIKVDGFDVAWAKGDELYVNSAQNVFTATEAGASAAFEGSLQLVDAQRLYVVFDVTNAGANFSADGTEYTLAQPMKAGHALTASAATNTATLGKQLFMYGATNEVSADVTNIGVNMKHGFAIQDLSLTNLDFSEGVVLSKIELVSDEPFLSEATFNIESGVCTPGAATVSSIPLTITTTSVKDEAILGAITEMKARLPILPQTIAASANWTIIATMSDDTQYTYTFPEATSDFEFVAGKCYNIDVDFSKMSVVEPIVELDVTTFTAADVEGKDVWYFNNSALAAGDIANLDAILGENAANVTVVFTKLKTVVKDIFKGSKIVNAEFPELVNVNSTSSFMNSDVVRLSMPLAAKVLGTSAFEGCANLVAINAPEGEDGIYIDGVTAVNNGAFKGCALITKASFALAAKVGNNTFEGCSNLESIELGSATLTGTYTFNECVKLESITAPKLAEYGNNSLRSCHALKSINATAEHPGVNLAGVAKLADYMLLDCTSVESVYAPDAEYMGPKALGGMTSLVNLEVATSSSVTALQAGVNLFMGLDATLYTDTDSIALVTGANNGSTVDGNNWSVITSIADDDPATQYTYAFASITTK